MTFDVFDARATLLYAEAPGLDFEQLADRATDWCNATGLNEPFTALPAESDGASRCFVGNGVHIRITVHSQPLDPVSFALPLRSPLLKHKDFDFAHAIETHGAAIEITVGDGETPVPLDACESMANDAAANGAHPFAKLGALQMALQVLAQYLPPLMVEFGPSQSLLSPQEVAAVSDLPLPIPILIHPFPFSQKTPEGKIRPGMAAIHAQHLIGAELELEAIPADMPMENRISTLATLVKMKMEDSAALSHGDSLETDDGETVWIRYEEGSIEGGPPRIIVSFDTPAPAQAPAQRQKSFQDRVAHLKKSSRDGMQPDTSSTEALPDDAQVYQESEEELRARVQATISPNEGRSGGRQRMGSPVFLLVLAAVGVYVFLTQSEMQIETFASALSDPFAEAESQPQIVTSGTSNTADSPQTSDFGKTVSVNDQPY